MSIFAVRVTTVAFSVGDELPIPTGDRANTEQLRDEAKRIVADFNLKNHASLWDTIWNWISRQIEKISDTADGSNGAWSQIGLVVLVIGVGAVAYFAIRGARGLTRESLVGRAFDDEEGRAPIDWRNDAEAYERRGDYRTAVRCWYRSLIAELAQRNVVRELAGKTAGEYRREIRAVGAAELYEPCRRVCDVFELVWYGDFSVTASDAQLARTLVNEALNVSQHKAVAIGPGIGARSAFDYTDYPPA